MMVIDASVWVSFFVKQDVNHAITHDWLTNVLLTGQPMVAPILLLAEIGGAMARRLDSNELGNQAIDRLLSIPTLRLVDTDHALGIETGRIATRCRLRGADAIYVAVAARLGIPLISWDKEHVTRATALITAYTPADESL